MLLVIVGMLLTMLTAFGGGIVLQYPVAGIIVIGIATIGLGTLVASLQSGFTLSGYEAVTTFTLNDLGDVLSDYALQNDTNRQRIVYLGGPGGLRPAKGVFTAILNNAPAIVIEAVDEKESRGKNDK